MTPFEMNLRRVERWIESIDRERDRLAASLDGTVLPLHSAVRVAFVRARLGTLEKERADAVHLLAELQLLQFHPALMFPCRPLLKAHLRRQCEERRRA